MQAISKQQHNALVEALNHLLELQGMAAEGRQRLEAGYARYETLLARLADGQSAGLPKCNSICYHI